MGHSIPVFVAAIDADDSLPDDASWWTANDLLAAAIEGGTVWQDTSRNWWHVDVTRRIAEYLGLSELSFLQRECACVPHESLPGVAAAIGSIEDHLRSVARPDELVADHRYDLVSRASVVDQFDRAEPVRVNETYSASDKEQARCYYSFLRLLQAAVAEAEARSGTLLVVQPQP